MRRAAVALLLLVACSTDRTGIVVQREWTRTVREQREECSTSMSIDADGYSHLTTSCHWITLQTWEEHGGVSDERLPVWPEFTVRSSSSLRYRRDERYAVTLRLPDGSTRDWTTDEGTYLAMRPGQAFAFTSGPWSIGSARPLEAEAPVAAEVR